jgi:signal transduction histidine kinase
MPMTHVPAVRRQSVRVALAATGVVALAYLVVAAGVVAFATANLTAQVDQRLLDSFHRMPPNGDQPGGGPPDPGRDPGRPFDAPFLVWVVQPDGAVLADSNNPDLPTTLYGVADPVTATIDGNEFRVAGQLNGGDRIVVAQSMRQVGDARSTIVLGELLIAPFLLGLVFLGAVVIGRRVAAPIEAARQRQLEFTADASHELRTPLSVIEANTSLALAQDRDADWYRTAFARVDRESRRMRRLLEDMLWLARFDAAQAPRATEPVDLGVLAAQAADRFAAIAEARHLTLSIHPPASPAVIAAAPDLVDRLIGVLLDNACKYAPDGGLVDVTVSIDGNRASVTVDDSGPGIPDGDRDRIFDRFHRATATAGETGGSGLGLAIGDAIARATGGHWAVGRSPSGGARFTVSWARASIG